MQEFPGIVSTGNLRREIYGTRENHFVLYTGNVFLCPASMPDDLAAAIMRAVFANLPTLTAATAAARDTTIQNTVNLVNQRFLVPFHPGALRYLRETGAIR
jgi:TRAP-type uncharacterized transport system substrate-binding protein